MRMPIVVLAALFLGEVPLPAAGQTATLERCRQLIDIFDRLYSKKDSGSGSSGSRLDRDIAEAQCIRGNYAEGIRQVEGAMRRNQIPIPPI